MTHDVWEQGRLIIPAGAEVHGKTNGDRTRDRVMSQGTFVFVWRDQTRLNGAKLVIEGIALDEDVNLDSGTFGMEDGSAGLKGEILQTDVNAQLQLFASTALSAVVTGLQSTDTVANTITGQPINVAENTSKNALLSGVSEVLNLYAANMLSELQGDMFYVRIPSGKQFYVYVTQNIDTDEITKDNKDLSKLWKTNYPAI